MPEAQISALQLHLFASDSPAYQDALGRYEEIRPILKQERTLAQHSRETGFSYWRCGVTCAALDAVGSWD
jgi:hypothetical protein